MARLRNEDAEQIVRELADALDEMLDKSCFEMAPLWLQETRRAREELGEHAIAQADFEPGRRYLALSPGQRSKYRGLASWRHAVVWRDVLPHLDEDFGRAVEAIYFTPYPDNTPPYAWSRRATACPRVHEFASATTLKNWGKEGANATGVRLVDECAQLLCGTVADEVRAGLLRCATRKSVHEVLKLDEFELWKKPDDRIRR